MNSSNKPFVRGFASGVRAVKHFDFPAISDPSPSRTRPAGDKTIAFRPIRFDAGAEEALREPEAGPSPEALAAKSAERIITGARAEADTIRDAAREEGFAKGKAQGLAAMENELRPLIESLTRSINEIEAFKAALRRDAEREAVELGMAIGRKLLRRELSVAPEAVLDVARAALERVASTGLIVLRVHPDDAEILEGATPGFSDMLSVGASIRIETDGAMARGGCRVSADYGNVDARLEHRIELVEAAIRSRLAAVAPSDADDIEAPAEAPHGPGDSTSDRNGPDHQERPE